MIVDNLNTHKPKYDRWLARHPVSTFISFLPMPPHASRAKNFCSAEALRENEPDCLSARLIVFLLKVVTQALKGRTNDECRQPTRLTDHFALIADAALAFVCESLHACENRIGIEMRFRDHFRFEAAASPGIVEVGGE